MKAEESIAIMKALADKSRIAIVNSLLEQPQYVEEIARRHALAPSTVSFHLRKLELAGLVRSRKEQYYAIFEAEEEIFATTLRQIVSAPFPGKELQEERIEEYRGKVLASFFRNGRLEKLPAQHKKRLIILDQFVQKFKPGRRYSEQEVTQLITPLYDDYCTIRRLLVDERLVSRDGTGYWREKGSDHAGEYQAQLPSCLPKQEKVGRETERRIKQAEYKRFYKQNSPDMGVYQILNKANGKIYVGSSRNLEGSRNSRLFQLRMGKIVFNRELQKDLTSFGADSFEFSILEIMKKPDRSDNIDHALAALELHWVDKLQPFGERGYNNAKKYQRNIRFFY